MALSEEIVHDRQTDIRRAKPVTQDGRIIQYVICKLARSVHNVSRFISCLKFFFNLKCLRCLFLL